MAELTAKVGDKIWFAEEVQGYTVRARNNRFIICTKPFNPKRTVLYTIIDLEREVRGPCNMIFGPGFETDEQIEGAMQRLQNHCDNNHIGKINLPGIPEMEYQASMEVTHRNFVPLVIHKIKVKK